MNVCQRYEREAETTRRLVTVCERDFQDPLALTDVKATRITESCWTGVCEPWLKVTEGLRASQGYQSNKRCYNSYQSQAQKVISMTRGKRATGVNLAGASRELPYAN